MVPSRVRTSYATLDVSSEFSYTVLYWRELTHTALLTGFGTRPDPRPEALSAKDLKATMTTAVLLVVAIALRHIVYLVPEFCGCLYMASNYASWAARARTPMW